MAYPAQPLAASPLSSRELLTGQDGLLQLWGRRGFWQIRTRWAVAPLMIAGLLVAWALGFDLPVLPILAIAAATPLYNAIFAWTFSRWEDRLRAEPTLDRWFTLLQVAFDYAAIFLLFHYTGGVASPLVVFLLFHVIIAAIQFGPEVSYRLAGLASGGLWLLLLAQSREWIHSHEISFRGIPVHFVDRPALAVVTLLFFTATLFLSAALVAQVMRRFRARVVELAAVSGELTTLNEQLESLYAILSAIGAERRLEPVLDTVTRELARVTRLPAVAVKLLEEDGETLRYVAAYGLPDELIREKVVYLARSPLNRRVIEGETLVEARIGEGETLQLRRELSELGIRSAVLAPLKVKERVIGTLGFYAHEPDRFEGSDTEFLRVAAELVAVAIDNARAYQAIEELMHERTRFMLQVAHNLRAPLGASLSLLDLLRGGYLGQNTPEQSEYLGRIESRLDSLNQTVGELLTIARTRDWSREIPDVVIDLSELAAHTRSTFADEAAKKGLSFEVSTDDALPTVDSGEDLLEQVLENLVSNAIKYTPSGGKVSVAFRRLDRDRVQIVVEDTGIGIPESEQGMLFQEFFRASNAKRLTTAGSGLGLVLVQQTVDRHHGHLELESEEGRGTRVTVDLPVRQLRHRTAPVAASP